MRAVFSLTVALAALAVVPATAGKVRSAVPSNPDARTIVHVLNRLGFGPAPGEVERVARLGLARYIDQQLHPESLPDSAMAARLSGFDTLGKSTQELARDYFLPAIEARRAVQQQASSDPSMRPADADPARDRGTPQQIAAMDAERRVLVELTGQKVLRAAYSDRQLEEVMIDFWFNHFNVFARQGADARLPDGVRARRDPAARARQVPRPARRDGEEPGDALLPGQLAERRPDAAAPQRCGASAQRFGGAADAGSGSAQQRAGDSTRTTAAS